MGGTGTERWGSASPVSYSREPSSNDVKLEETCRRATVRVVVSVYPYVGDRERDAAVRRIAQRHRHEDPSWSQAGSEGDDPARDVLAYLHKQHARLPRAVSTADAVDALVLAGWIWWDERRRERELLRRARSYGHSLRELGAFLGLETRQATYEYLDRLDALIAAHTADQDRQAYVAAVYVAGRRAAGAADQDPGVVAGPQATAALDEQDDLYRRNRGRRPRHAGADVGERRERRRD
jgi:hypothetical protein